MSDLEVGGLEPSAPIVASLSVGLCACIFVAYGLACVCVPVPACVQPACVSICQVPTHACLPGSSFGG